MWVQWIWSLGSIELSHDQVIVHIHTRLTPDFFPILLPQLLAILMNPSATSSAASKDADKEREKEEKERLARQRPVLRIVAELALIGAWADGEKRGFGEVGNVVKFLVRFCFEEVPIVSRSF